MRFGSIVLSTLVGTAVLMSTPARSYVMPYDPYPWCAVYGGRGGGGTNCGFLTIEQCRATVSGIGGFCAPNQFYNPRPAARARKKQAN
ncbi:MAG: DUF3551 domain-containing protein [Pseudolabrys sp.]|jgi:hypothetical protein